MDGLAADGLPHAHVPWGYRREYAVDDRGRRYLVGQFPDEEVRTTVDADGATVEYSRAGVIREIAKRVLSGEAIMSIGFDLNRRGIPTFSKPTKGGWVASEVRRRVLNPAYAGLRVHRGEVVGKAIWEPIIDPADHYAIVAKFSDPARRQVKPATLAHLGSGLFLCGECGSIVRALRRKNKGVATHHYVCWPARRIGWTAGPGHCVSRALAGVDAYVQRSIWLRLTRPDIADLVAQDEVADAEMDALTAEIAEKQVRLDTARDSYAEGRLPFDSLERIEARLGPEIARARAGLHRARLGPVLEGLALPDVRDVEAEWWRRSLSQRREVIQALTLRVEILKIYPRRKVPAEESVRITWRQPHR